jgi:tyrosinase
VISPAEKRKLNLEFKNVSPKQKIKPVKLDVDINDLRIVPEKFLHKHLLDPHWFWHIYFCKPRYRVRKNQKILTEMEWQRFIHAIEALAEATMPSPNYDEFVEIHRQAMETPAGHAWGAHGGISFLSWHREYLAKLEARLIAINPLVSIPYWNWVEDRVAIPTQLSDPTDISDWGITRGGSFNGSSLATAANVANLMAITDFPTFTSTLEQAPFHNRLHGLVGGTMVLSTSPADPLFWLHHGFIDKLWADWQVLHPGVNPSNMTTTLQPPTIMTRKVSEVIDTRALGYVYG